MRNTWLLAVLIVLSIPLISSAQDADPAYDSNPTPDCSSELFDEALHIFRDTLRADAISRERKLSKILKECPDAPWNSQVSDFLKSTREESAEHLFSIAKYYQDLYNSRRQGGLKGAYSRYRQIVEKYPKYSKLALTLLNLGDVETSLGNFDEAWSSYQRLINDLPTSPLVDTAFKRLQTLEEIRIKDPN